MTIDINPIWNTTKSLLGRCVISLDKPIYYAPNPDFVIDMKCVTIGLIITVIFIAYFIFSYPGWR